ncbi:MAG TPA: acyclic terpene utilization AtuA family protein [Vicinamibacterales bacterium]|nr:acyclic terpene utilization AtuA family protein [Vicinamibacterales bacterium]
MKTVRIGCGAGFAGDRIEPAIELATKGDLDYLVFECLAERTIALAQQAKARDPQLGYDFMLAARMEAVLPVCRERGTTIITNMGAANPSAGAEVVRRIAERRGLKGLSIAAIVGDDVMGLIEDGDFTVMETGEPVRSLADRLVSANAYIGADPIVRALEQKADVVIMGRAADPSLFVGPLMHAHGQSLDDCDQVGRATLVGHLLECGGQVTGGYFADPGLKDVPGLDNLGFPLAEVPERGPLVITKVPGTGGVVTPATCKEQLLYEIHDPAAYMTPDTIADFSNVRVEAVGPDRVQVDGATGGPRPDLLKVSLAYRDSFIGEGQISYAGAGAEERARLAADIVVRRLARAGVHTSEIRCDLIGIDALHGSRLSRDHNRPYEVRLRVAARANTLPDAQAVANEVESLYTNGPAGGGGATRATREVLSLASTFVPRHLVRCDVRMVVI